MALAMVRHCNRAVRHREGEVDGRVVAFVDALAVRFPLDDANSPWMTTPDVGIDHVIMNLSFSARSDSAIEAIQQLARDNDLILVDLQSDDVYPPRPRGHER